MRKIRTERRRASSRESWTPEEIAEACEVTADLLDGGHWTKGSWIRQERDPNDDDKWLLTYCVEGALAAALGLDVYNMAEGSTQRGLLMECPVYAAVLTTVWENGRYEPDLIHWNDTYVNGEQQVLDTLHATAKRVLGVPRDDA